MNRVFVECTHTASTNLNTGIQRVVRQITQQWGDQLPDGTPVHLMYYDGDHGYEIDHLPDFRGTADLPPTDRPQRSSLYSMLYHFRAGLQKKRLKLAENIKWSPAKRWLIAPRNQPGLARICYLLVGKPIGMVRDIQKRRYKAAHPPITFHSSDVLLLLDASWHYPLEKLTAPARKAGVTIITVTYDLIPIKHPSLCDDKFTRMFRKWLKEILMLSDGFVAISRTVRDDVEQYAKVAGGSTEASRYGYFYLGAELAEKTTSARPELVRTLNVENSYLIVCTIEPRKNHAYLFETFKKLWAAGVDVNLHIVGRAGWKIDDFLATLRAHPEYQQRLFIWHDLNDGELVYCYQHAKALLFPSIIEGFGLPIIEAQHYQLPVLASDTPIHREIGQDSIGYFDIDDPDALYHILQSVEAGTQSLPVSNPDVLNDYTWQQSANKLASEIQRIHQQVSHSAS